MQTIREQLFHRPLTLLLGGTGTAGHEVAQRLWDAGCPIRIGARFADPPFDWRDRTSWRPALRNVQAVYLGFHPGRSGLPAERVLPDFVDLAIATGVSRIVLVSRPDELHARRCERAIREAGVDWTIIRVPRAGADGAPPGAAGGIACLAVEALTRTGRSERLHELAADCAGLGAAGIAC